MSGVAKHVGAALKNQRLLGGTRGHKQVVSIGIAPWGLVENKEALIGRNKERTYNPLEHTASKSIILNPRHSNFLFVDNGSSGKLGGESVFRKRFEKCIASYPISSRKATVQLQHILMYISISTVHGVPISTVLSVLLEQIGVVASL